MSKQNNNAATVEVDNKTVETETAEQRAERQARESAILRLSASRISQFITGDNSNHYDVPVSRVKGLLSFMVGDSLSEDEIKPKQQTAAMKFAYLLNLSDDDFNTIVDALRTARDDFKVCNESKATIAGGIQSHIFAAQVAGSFMPDSSAASALSYKTAALKSMIALGFVKENPA